MKMPITSSIDMWYEWEPAQADRDRCQALFGRPLEQFDALSLADLCRVLFPDVAHPLTGGEYLMLLVPFAPLRGDGATRPTASRKAPGRIGYGHP